jgi:hypothetical protein
MTDTQLYLAIGVPVFSNAILVGLFMAYINAKFEGVNQRFEGVTQHLDDRSLNKLITIQRIGLRTAAGQCDHASGRGRFLTVRL